MLVLGRGSKANWLPYLAAGAPNQGGVLRTTRKLGSGVALAGGKGRQATPSRGSARRNAVGGSGTEEVQ
jgi:hypothetical protein